ncbi:ankyrin repeat-containing domain protein [Lasiosphaeria miniovina]|uniref:Ankyrin repeat-containing domain protein n=1 Tax=Lasiosphaeria miniovina TaxID=1954250 RepID=A0AA40ABC6_9PEZI|nr:ankyrin repeat-containing domain protein [Lasiosphaeria miniovina]KAK0712513.1 ankyrin repeat-containing domain protein [Lasiosphaeria miniovina]
MIAALHGDDGDNSDDPFQHLNHIQRAALGLGDMATALEGSTKGRDDQDDGGRAPAHHVCQRGDVDGLRLLLYAGAHVDVRDDFDATPLMMASENGYVACVRLLVELGGADVDVRDCPGRTALHYAAGAPHLGAHEIIEYLLSKKARYGRTNLGAMPIRFLGPPDQRGVGGPLDAESVEAEASQRFEALLRFGAASLDEVDGSGRRPVDWAMREEKASVLKVLIRAGAMLDGLSLDGRSILHHAAMHGKQRTIAVLLNEADLVNLNVGHRDKHGDTPEDCLRLRKEGGRRSDHWAQVRIQSQEEEDAIRTLFREIRKRNEAADVRVCVSVKEALQHHDGRGALRLLTPLMEQKRAWKKDGDVETLDAIVIQIKERVFDAAIESLDEVMELWRKGEDLLSLAVECDRG